MKKLGFFLTFLMVFLAIVYTTLFIYGLPRTHISSITSCTYHGARLLAAANGQIRIPYSLRYLNFYLPFSPSLCEIHLKKYRGNAEDIKRLNAHLGAYSILSQNSWGAERLRRNLSKNIENFKFLVSKGLDVNAIVDFGVGPVNSLYLAVNNGDIEITQILLDNGADPNIRDKWGFTPLERKIKLKEEQLGSSYDSSKDFSGIVGILKEAQLKK
jgi:Ankyrin repeats (many copies)